MFEPEPWSFTFPGNPWTRTAMFFAVSQARRMVVIHNTEGLVAWQLQRCGTRFREVGRRPTPFDGPGGPCKDLHNVLFSGTSKSEDLLIQLWAYSKGGDFWVVRWDPTNAACQSTALPVAFKGTSVVPGHMIAHEDQVVHHMSPKHLSVWRRTSSGEYVQQWSGCIGGLGSVRILDSPICGLGTVRILDSPNNFLYCVVHPFLGQDTALEAVMLKVQLSDGRPCEQRLVKLWPKTLGAQIPHKLLWDNGVYSVREAACAGAGGEVVWKAECLSSVRPPLFLPDAMVRSVYSLHCFGHGVQIEISRHLPSTCCATLWATHAGRRNLRPLRCVSWLAVCSLQ